MAENLQLPITAGRGVEASYNDGTTFTYTPTSTAMDGITITPRSEAMAAADGKGHVGEYYYTWRVAVAEKSDGSVVEDIDGSLCPKGWRLPTIYSASNTIGWGVLTGVYLGIVDNTSNTGNAYTVLNSSPISMLQYGYYHPSVGYVYDWSNGHLWSSHAAGNTISGGCAMTYDTTRIIPSGCGTDSFRVSYPARCIASPLVH